MSATDQTTPPPTGAAMQGAPAPGSPPGANPKDAQLPPIGPDDPAPYVSSQAAGTVVLAGSMLLQYRAEAAGQAPKGKVFAAKENIKTMWDSIKTAGGPAAPAAGQAPAGATPATPAPPAQPPAA